MALTHNIMILIALEVFYRASRVPFSSPSPAAPTIPPLQHHILHWLAATETHIVFDEAVAKYGEVHIDGWLNEWDVVNKDETAPDVRSQRPEGNTNHH